MKDESFSRPIWSGRNNGGRDIATHVRVDVFYRSFVDEDLVQSRAVINGKMQRRVVRTWGTECGMFAKGVLLSAQLQRRWNVDSLRISDTGDTLSDVPMTRIRSTSPLSTCRASSNASVSFSPKNVISGWAF